MYGEQQYMEAHGIAPAIHGITQAVHGLILGLRSRWSKETKSVMLNWHGQWYEIKEDLIRSNDIYKFLQ
jgi:hypothetical protein